MPSVIHDALDEIRRNVTLRLAATSYDVLSEAAAIVRRCMSFQRKHFDAVTLVTTTERL